MTNVVLTGLARELARRADEGRPVRIGVIGSGEMGTDLVTQCMLMKGVTLSAIATRRPADALRLLDQTPADAADREHDFLVMHALFAGVVAGDAAMTAPAARERFTTIGQRYVQGEGRHADLVREWLAVATPAGLR